MFNDAIFILSSDLPMIYYHMKCPTSTSELKHSYHCRDNFMLSSHQIMISSDFTTLSQYEMFDLFLRVETFHPDPPILLFADQPKNLDKMSKTKRMMRRMRNQGKSVMLHLKYLKKKNNED